MHDRVSPFCTVCVSAGSPERPLGEPGTEVVVSNPSEVERLARRRERLIDVIGRAISVNCPMLCLPAPLSQNE